MPTKTISIDLKAYERLCAARRSPNESFSHVIKRAHWRSPRGIPIVAANVADFRRIDGLGIVHYR
jgi:predicted CopG family antitoxin